MPGLPTSEPSRGFWHRCAESSGSSTAKSRSPGHSRCCAISRATPTASPSRTAGSSPLMMVVCRSAGRTIALKVLASGNHDAYRDVCTRSAWPTRIDAGFVLGEPIEELQQGVDLVVMTAVRERQELAFKIGQPGGFFWQQDS